MTARAWLAGELGSAVVFAVPTFVLTVAGVRHVVFYGEPWILYLLSVIWFWGPGPLLAFAVLLQSRERSMNIGWGLSVVAAVVMSALSVFVLWGFARQGDVHWSLWAMWVAAGLGTALTVAAVAALLPSRRVNRDQVSLVAR